MKRWWVRLIGLLLLALFATAACANRQSPGVDSGIDLSDPEVGGGAGVEAGPETPIPTATPTNEASPRLDEAARATIDSRAPTIAPPTPIPPTVAPPTEAPLTAEPPTLTPPPAEPSPAASPTPAGEIIHVVQPGENLYRIGLQYGLSWVAIAEYNGITNPDAISAGQELRIPPAPTPTAEASADDGEQVAVPAQDVQSPAVETAAVAPGDTLYSIARRYGVSWDQLAEANGLTTPNQIVAGQLLKIPADVQGPAPEFAHRVRPGETLAAIARQYGIAAAELAEANGLAAPYVIYAGQSITIPGE